MAAQRRSSRSAQGNRRREQAPGAVAEAAAPVYGVPFFWREVARMNSALVQSGSELSFRVAASMRASIGAFGLSS